MPTTTPTSKPTFTPVRLVHYQINRYLHQQHKTSINIQAKMYSNICESLDLHCNSHRNINSNHQSVTVIHSEMSAWITAPNRHCNMH